MITSRPTHQTDEQLVLYHIIYKYSFISFMWLESLVIIISYLFLRVFNWKAKLTNSAYMVKLYLFHHKYVCLFGLLYRVSVHHTSS